MKLIKYLTAYFTLGSVQFLSAAEARVAVGAKVTISVVVNDGTAPFTYQWKKNGGDIPGATGETYTIPSVTTSDAAKYSVVVTNKAGFTRSDDASITLSVASAITTQPVNQSGVVGKPVTFSVVAIGTAPLTYQWRKNGVNVVGATGATYTIPSAKMEDVGTYSVVVTNSEGVSATSLDALLSVTIAPPARAVTGIITG